MPGRGGGGIGVLAGMLEWGDKAVHEGVGERGWIGRVGQPTAILFLTDSLRQDGNFFISPAPFLSVSTVGVSVASASSAPKAFLLLTSDKGELKTIPIRPRVHIHRDAKYEVVSSESEEHRPLDIRDGMVSRKHAEFYWEAGELWVRDLGSKNGTDVDGRVLPGWNPGRPSEAVCLAEGERIYIGNRVMISVERAANRLTVMGGDTLRLPAGMLRQFKGEGFQLVGRDEYFCWVRAPERSKGSFRVKTEGKHLEVNLRPNPVQRGEDKSELLRQAAAYLYAKQSAGPTVRMEVVPETTPVEDLEREQEKIAHRFEKGDINARTRDKMLNEVNNKLDALERELEARSKEIAEHARKLDAKQKESEEARRREEMMAKDLGAAKASLEQAAVRERASKDKQDSLQGELVRLKEQQQALERRAPASQDIHYHIGQVNVVKVVDSIVSQSSLAGPSAPGAGQGPAKEGASATTIRDSIVSRSTVGAADAAEAPSRVELLGAIQRELSDAVGGLDQELAGTEGGGALRAGR
jgi:hypothetical protein